MWILGERGWSGSGQGDILRFRSGAGLIWVRCVLANMAGDGDRL
jgi:hypothetical protein